MTFKRILTQPAIMTLPALLFLTKLGPWIYLAVLLTCVFSFAAWISDQWIRKYNDSVRLVSAYCVMALRDARTVISFTHKQSRTKSVLLLDWSIVKAKHAMDALDLVER